MAEATAGPATDVNQTTLGQAETKTETERPFEDLWREAVAKCRGDAVKKEGSVELPASTFDYAALKSRCYRQEVVPGKPCHLSDAVR